MEPSKSIELIETMLKESKKSFYNNSFYFIMWGIILALAGLAEYFMYGQEYHWIAWPIVTTLGGLLSSIYGIREGKRQTVMTMGDRMIMLIWVGFMFALVFAIVYSIMNKLTPHALVLAVTAYATFLTGGVSRFKPLLFGSLAMAIAAVLAGFVLPMPSHGLLFAIAITLGYIVPGIMLRKSEDV